MERSRRGGSSRRQRKRRNSADDVSDVYRELLEEAASSTSGAPTGEGRALKKRRTAARPSTEHKPAEEQDARQERGSPESTTSKQKQQVEFDETESSAQSDVDWEDVDLAAENNESDSSLEDEPEPKTLDLVLENEGSTKRRRAHVRRGTLNVMQRKLRLEIHKVHLLGLFVHVYIRNSWCNDTEVQARLRALLPERTVSYLTPNPNHSQFQASRSFQDGLQQASELWRAKFKITARGLRRATWAEGASAGLTLSDGDDFDPPLQRADFRELVSQLKGSRDVAAQLFCALLRSINVDARLVCSMQTLPLLASPAKGSTPQYPIPALYAASKLDATDYGDGDSEEQPLLAGSRAPTADASSPSPLEPLVPKRARRLGQTDLTVDAAKMDLGRPHVAQAPKPKRFKESLYPVFWIEAFNAAIQKWIAVDPLVTKTIAKASKLEPPASDQLNCMNYVIAFEDDGTARDVTRRYAKAFNAKTRKTRVESTKGGNRWWRRAMEFYSRDHVTDRDQVEDAELADLEAREPMPRNVQDFKDHPIYALERHLRRNEVIHPKVESGKVAVGKSGLGVGTKGLEPIYRRRDVHIVRSADAWYKLGRDIKPGEQPLKHVPPRRRASRQVRDDDENEDNSESDGTASKGLYAAFQTTLYEAPPIINGRVPKNSYGNLDIFVPSMVPSGGTHIPHAEAARAARLLGIDYADAVTGFEFKGRHASAVTRGVVAAVEYRDAIEVVVQGLRNEEREEELAQRSRECLRMWKRFLVGLRVNERISGYEVEGEGDAVMADDGGAGADEDEGGGGFLPESGGGDGYEEGMGGGFL